MRAKKAKFLRAAAKGFTPSLPWVNYKDTGVPSNSIVLQDGEIVQLLMPQVRLHGCGKVVYKRMKKEMKGV